MARVIVFVLILCLLFSAFLTGSDPLTAQFKDTIGALLDSIAPCVIILGGIFFVIRSVLA